MERWSRSDKLTLVSLLVAIIGAGAAIIVVPEVRRIFGLDEQATSTGLTERIKSLPVKVWLILGAALILWFILLLILKRAKAVRSRNGIGIDVVNSPVFGWEPVGELTHAGVVWTVRAPKTHFARITQEPRIDPSQLNIQTPPKCPQCKTELEQERRFLGGYRWTCISCGFRKKNKDSYYREADRALKIARTKI